MPSLYGGDSRIAGLTGDTGRLRWSKVESLVFGRHLSRDGYDLIGALADAQILGKSIDDVLAKRNAATLAQMDVEFRRWLLDRAVVVTPR